MALAAAALPLLVSCPLSMGGGDDDAGGVGSLEISVSSSDLSSSRNLSPDVPLEVVSYDIAGTGPSGKTFSVAGLTPGSTRSVSNLVPGAWSVVATGFNASGQEIVTAAAPATVLSGKTTPVPLTCTPFTGTGILTLNVSWPIDTVAATARMWASWAVTGSSFGEPTEFSTPAQSGGNVSTAWTNSGLQNGFYTLKVQLKDGASILWTSNIETVLVLKGKTTSGSWTLSAGNLAQGGVAMSLGSATYPPATVTLEGAVAQLSQAPGRAMTVSASSDLAPATWEWYLDGENIPGASTNSHTVEGKDLSRGVHTLDAVVYGGNRAGSKGTSFLVELSDMLPFSDIVAGYASNKADILEGSSGTYTLRSGPGLADDGSEDTLNEFVMELPNTPRRGGKAFLGILAARDGTPLTGNYSVSFERQIVSGTDVMMYFNLTVDGPDVENKSGSSGVLVAFPCEKPEPTAARYVLRPQTAINNISGGTIEGITRISSSVFHDASGDVATLQTLIDKGLVLKNLLTKDKGAPQTKVLAGTLIIVGDTLKGNMSNAEMVVSKLAYSF